LRLYFTLSTFIRIKNPKCVLTMFFFYLSVLSNLTDYNKKHIYTDIQVRDDSPIFAIMSCGVNKWYTYINKILKYKTYVSIKTNGLYVLVKNTLKG
jgi:hypothetical protein